MVAFEGLIDLSMLRALTILESTDAGRTAGTAGTAGREGTAGRTGIFLGLLANFPTLVFVGWMNLSASSMVLAMVLLFTIFLTLVTARKSSASATHL